MFAAPRKLDELGTIAFVVENVQIGAEGDSVGTP
jgi:hypothetical protein